MERSIAATDDIMLLRPDEHRETQTSRNSSLVRDEAEPRKHDRKLAEPALVKRSNNTFWKVWDAYRRKPWNMFLLVLIGTLFAVGHHLFYLRLNGREAINQSLMLRYGTAIAFCAKASLGTAVTVAFHRRAWRVINDQFVTSMSLYNSTIPPGESLSDSNPDGFDYYTGPSRQYDMFIRTKSTLMSESIIRKQATVEICGLGWNCSYVVNFVAPGYKCEELAYGVNSEVKKLGNATVPFNPSVLAPTGNLTYYAVNDRGEYLNPQMVSYHPGGRPTHRPPYPDNFGAFRTEPIMWVGYATVDDLSVPQPYIPGTEEYMKAYTPVIIGCEHYEVNYTVQFNYTRGDKLVEIKWREYLRKVVDTTYISEKDPDKRLRDRTCAIPDNNYIFPNDVKTYRRTAAYHSIGSRLRQCLNGTMKVPYNEVKSDLLYTRLFTPLNYLPVKNLHLAIQKLYEDMIISIFEEPSFMVVSWAANGKPSGIAKGGPSTAYPCRRERIATFFHYNTTQLLSVYSTCIFLAVIGVLLGLQAYQGEGTMRDMKPSSIMEASRASNLHVLGEREGCDVKIGYGLVHEEAGRSVRSFGVEGNVQQ
ncbi:hypothetical protein FDENT_8056 [Fusarium denticulatum]|uniref:Uncharacterized protein n=1 Tax=Fusarium denticulatum TaxID=48507 RepID=A0A8H5U058_9HYPO|nr:hypothetical protein FDENT_8056 [Fusarium denticulatum]